MTLVDQAGVLGVGLVLVAYAGAAFGKMDARGWPSLALNLIGSLAILASLTQTFNLSAALMEGAWAAVAAAGLIRLAWLARR